MKGSFHNWPILLLEFFIIFSSGFLICNSEYFQSLIAPEKFWECKAVGLEKSLKQVRCRVRELEISLEQAKQNEKFLIQQAVNRAKIFGDDEIALANQAKRDHEKHLGEIESELEVFRVTLLSNEQELEQTLSHLYKIQHSDLQ